MVAGSRTCKHFQAASQVNSHSNRYRPARPMRSRSAGLASRLDTASWKPGASSASNKCSPARAGRPSAPIGVETTGTPAAQASMILTRVPLPASTGTRGPGLDDLDTGPAASQHRYYSHLGARQFQDRIRDRAGELNARIAADDFCNSLRVLADQPPHQSRPARAQVRPNLLPEVAHGGDIRMVLEIAGKNDHILLVLLATGRRRHERYRIRVHQYMRAGRNCA